MEKNNKKIINAWCTFDVANSVYKLLITSVLFPLYYALATKRAFGSEMVDFLGYQIKNTIIYDYAFATAFLIVALISPLFSGIADFGGTKKRFMIAFTTLGAGATFLMYWFTGDNILFGLATVLFAAIGYEGAVLFYNAFLPEIATPEHHDRISAKGYAWGYTGAIILLGTNLFIITKFQWFGFVDELAALRFAFIQTGVWWFAFSLISFFYLKEPKRIEKRNKMLLNGFHELQNVWKFLKTQATIKRFLLSFFFYSAGLQTMMFVSTIFAKNVLHMESQALITIILLIQVLGITGAIFFAFLSRKQGNKFSLIIMILIWAGVCLFGYFIKTPTEFYVLAAFVGFVMGGIQSVSRSTFSKLIPTDSLDTASFFGFYNIAEKLAIVFGMFMFGFIEHITGNIRNSILSLIIVFIVSLLIMIKTKIPKYHQI